MLLSELSLSVAVFNEIRKVTLTQTINSGKIFVRNLNTNKHIIQPKHAWDKLIKLTGDIEEDCKM